MGAYSDMRERPCEPGLSEAAELTLALCADQAYRIHGWLTNQLQTSDARQHASLIEPGEMASKRPTTIAEYIRAAPRDGQPHLRRLYAILKSVAPEAEEAIKWGTPFFVEPRFLFAFSAHKAHLS